MVRAASLVALCSIFTRRNRYSGRRRITEAPVLRGLEVRSSLIQSNSSGLESGGGPICERFERSTADFCPPVPPTRSLEHECSVIELEEPSGIFSPSVQHDSLLPNESSARAGGDCVGGAVLAQPMLVPVLNVTSDGLSTPSVPIQVVADVPVGGMSPTDQERIHPLNRLAALRSFLVERGFPSRVIELILGATRTNTHSAYQSAWVALEQLVS
jgi:hypothetical protein